MANKNIDLVDFKKAVREGRFKAYVAKGMCDGRLRDVIYLKDVNSGEVIQLGAVTEKSILEMGIRNGICS